ncbi:MAG: TM0106 family RecB-like putative nuclease [Thermoanaerobaculia bacterium]
MRLDGDQLILSTSDLTTFTRCDHATLLTHGVKRGTIKPLAMRPPSKMAELLSAKGDEHEHAYVDRLRKEGHEVVDIDAPQWTVAGLRHAESQTLRAMQNGAEYIAQATFFDGRWTGRADLLMRIPSPSNFGTHSYEVIDTKLSRTVKAPFVLQLADYSDHLRRLQGTTPERMHVELGSGDRETFLVADFDAYHRHVRASLDRTIERNDVRLPYPVAFCSMCDWWAHCSRQWSDVDHLSLVANLRRTHASRLERAHIDTLTALAKSDPLLRVPRIAPATFATLQHQARLQHQAQQTGVHTFELLPLAKEQGFARLPRPSQNDVFFDIEGDPFIGEGLTFLFGIAYEENGEARYRSWWAHDHESERIAFEAVMDLLHARHRADRASHIYHYGSIEAATLKRLASRHATREKELDDLLRYEAFVDLSSIVRQGMRVSHASYGLKSVETFYFERKEHDVREAGGALLAYEAWLATQDQTYLDAIEAYNREDCVSILEMRTWLIDSVRPADATWKESLEPKELKEDRIAREQKNDELFQALMQRGESLLAQLLYYHPREQRAGWWPFMTRRDMDEQELFEDSECISKVELDESVAPDRENRSVIYTYRFPPQVHKFDRGDAVHDTRTRKGAGTIYEIDDAKGVLRLARDVKLIDQEHPQALMPDGPNPTDRIIKAQQRFATSYLASETKYAAAIDLLHARAPRLLGDGPLDDTSDVTRRLDRSYVFVQGPPGSGKTYTGARVIVELLRAKKRIGVMSNSHKAIHTLLEEVEKVASEQHVNFSGLKFGDRYDGTTIKMASGTKKAATADLITGTAWLFSKEELNQTLDYLFIDEAGQVPLANALAAATSAHNVVLLGDPLQLPQISQAAHPDNVSVSVLQHLLGDHETVPRDRGIFLDKTFRMHPSVCEFVSRVVYENRLQAHESCAKQAITIDGNIETGLRFMPVEHQGNSQASDEEAECIVAEITRLLRGRFTNRFGEERELCASDVLIVAAYNAQVRRIQQRLSAAGLGEVPVGTVDKFQGREAPIVFFSMATSSAAELPRDIEFLFSRNRLNVAISRARCMAIVVANPRLLDVDCRTPEQMQLVNALCRFVEMSR